MAHPFQEQRGNKVEKSRVAKITKAYANGGAVVVGAAAHLADSVLQFASASQDALHDISTTSSYIGVAAGDSFDPGPFFDNVPLVIGCRTTDYTAGDGILHYSIYYELVALT